MKKLLILLLVLIVLSGFSGYKGTGFELCFSTYNHAEGIVSSYKITDKQIAVSVKALIEERDSIVYTSKIRQDVIEKIKLLKLNSLETAYYNNCILMVSGDEYFIGLYDEGISKQIHLHHYYQRDIGHLVELINLSVPEKYHIDYVSEDTEQNCP